MNSINLNELQREPLKLQVKRSFTQLFHFGCEQALSCIFPAVIFASLALTKIIPLPFLPRYDWLLIIFLLMQGSMVRSGLETRDELKVITLFHLIGLTLEIFKVHMGSWSYPEEGYFKIFGVPLYSGFMYASVASYLCQAWRRLKVELISWPPFFAVVMLAAAIYLNFFTHHYWLDIRWWLAGLVIIVFWQSWVTYEVHGTRYRMPLVLSFVLIGFFIWIAENIATFFGAWQYPNQANAWSLVHLGKVSSWVLLVIVSFLIVATLKQVKGGKKFRGARPSLNVTMKIPFFKMKQAKEFLPVPANNLPKHIAIIMDGNGRWAGKRGMPRVAGHQQGVSAIVKIVKAAVKYKVKVLTLYAFSTENWKRPKAEVEFILRLPKEFLNLYLPDLIANNVRIGIIGDLETLPPHTREAVQYAIDRTRDNDGLQLNFALNYGSRHEILKAMKEIAGDINDGKLSVNEVNEQLMTKYLYTSDWPEPDLLIRTGGEQRLSNFLLWQLAYTELWFTDVLWPDFSEQEFVRALEDYQKRQRRFGGLKELDVTPHCKC